MIIIKRLLQPLIERRLFQGKIIVLYGARQVGKTTLAKSLMEKFKEESLYLNCELLSVRDRLSVPEAINLKSYFGHSRLIVLDEAQKIPHVGTILKILVDTYPEIQIIATGSSSINLLDKTQEPLTGRKIIFKLYPLSLGELYPAKDLLKISKASVKLPSR